jgi:hypothetical protein
LLLNRSRQLGDGRIDVIQDFQQIAHKPIFDFNPSSRP